MKVTKLISKSIKLDSEQKYTRLFSTKNSNAISLHSGHVVLKQNESIGEHNTGDSEEVLIILEGKGQLHINRCERLDFDKNTALYIPPNTIHDIKNRGRGLLKYVFITSQIPLPAGKRPRAKARGSAESSRTRPTEGSSGGKGWPACWPGRGEGVNE